MNAQEALKSLVRIAGESPNAYNIKPQIDVLQQLIDRATPKKVIDGFCPNPNCPAVISSQQNYCEHCGQAIDWTNESEQIAKGEGE